MARTLMIVDDSIVIRRLIARSVSGPDVEVVGTADNGVEALELFRNHRPELVTMDITMPEMDGLTCVRELLKIDPDTRILVVSALADKPTAVEALKRGALGYLTKPFTGQELDRAFAELLQT